MIKSSPDYWKGNVNKLIRYYFYCQRGLDLFNNFRYVFMAIFGLYYAMKLKNATWLLVMLGVSLPILGVIGFMSVHHVGKVIDWLNIKFSSHYGIYQIELLERIAHVLEKGNKDIH